VVDFHTSCGKVIYGPVLVYEFESYFPSVELWVGKVVASNVESV